MIKFINWFKNISQKNHYTQIINKNKYLLIVCGKKEKQQITNNF